MKPLVIIGPTASGKTALSLWAANTLGQWNPKASGVDIFVVDSKQVYRYQDIVTGKDLPEKFNPSVDGSEFKHFSDGQTRIFGIDIVEPNQEWSVAHFLSYAKAVKEYSVRDGRQLIIVGGTPLYTLSLFRAPATAAIPPNLILRAELEKDTVEALQKRLKKIHASRWVRMNHSDQNNPRRLIRAIEVEIAHSLEDSAKAPHLQKPLFSTLLREDECLWVGLKAELDMLETKITSRVQQRLQSGAIDEYQTLQKNYPDWRKEAKSAMGYYEIEQCLESHDDQDTLTQQWALHEVQYAKRQMQWWKRERQIHWFEAFDPNIKEQVLLKLKDCYNQTV